MTLLFTEGFDWMGVNDGSTYGKWFENVVTGGGACFGSFSHGLTTGRFGSGSAFNVVGSINCQPWSNSVYFSFDTGAEQTTIFTGFGFYLNDGGSDIWALQMLDENFALQIDLRINGARFPYLTRNGTVLCTGSGTIPLTQWQWVEVGTKIDPSVGWAEMRINGALVASYYGTTGTNRATANGNTRNSAISGVRFVRYGSASSANFNRTYDDIVINNASGTVNNDFMGDVRVVGLLPNAVGTNSQLSRVGGTSSGNFTAVNENPIDGDTSYVSSAAVGAMDTYKFASLPAGAAQVLAVTSQQTARRDDAGSRTITTRVRSGGTEADASGTSALGTSYQTYRWIMETNPVTAAAWTVSDANAVEAGPKITA